MDTSDRILLRDDGRLAITHKNLWMGSVIDPSSVRHFVERLRDAITDATGMTVDRVNVVDQLKDVAQEVSRIDPDVLVSYDVWLTALGDSLLPGLPRIDLQTSREFDINAPQQYGTRSVTRPEYMQGYSEEESQHVKLQLFMRNDELEAANTVLLVDDDSVTGRLFEAAKERIRKYNPNANIRTLTMAEMMPFRHADVVDARDFIFGSYAGGLVCVDPCTSGRTLMRVPYLAPYVNLSTRMTLPPAISAQLGFSHRIIDMNHELFADTGLTVGQMSMPFQHFVMEYVNLNEQMQIRPTTTMEEFCSKLKQHIYL